MDRRVRAVLRVAIENGTDELTAVLETCVSNSCPGGESVPHSIGHRAKCDCAHREDGSIRHSIVGPSEHADKAIRGPRCNIAVRKASDGPDCGEGAVSSQ